MGLTYIETPSTIVGNIHNFQTRINKHRSRSNGLPIFFGRDKALITIVVTDFADNPSIPYLLSPPSPPPPTTTTTNNNNNNHNNNKALGLTPERRHRLYVPKKKRWKKMHLDALIRELIAYIKKIKEKINLNST